MPEPTPTSETPSEAPGTPNSATTSLSSLSTTAIKDGHRGSSFPLLYYGHQQRPSSNTLEAERADRISRLAGLERISAGRAGLNQAQAGVGSSLYHTGGQIPGYFDQNGNPIYATKISTVGSASATESISGQATTWASSSVKEDEEIMSEGTADERDIYSMCAVDEDVDRDADGMSDSQSLVAFGEGAGSTVSGPIYVRNRAVVGQSQSQSGSGTQMSGEIERPRREVKNNDSLADESSCSGCTEIVR
ncbi:hypothetical protein K3495_g1834 [Podosphaera aphanis]|nr:hypothetical protein K3495_g1834 [Podosphaera aphanis]